MLKAIGWKREHALQLAVGRQQGDAELLGVPRRLRADRRAVQPDLAAVGVVDSVDGGGDLGDAGADQPVQADDLAGPDATFTSWNWPVRPSPDSSSLGGASGDRRVGLARR